MAEVNKVVLKQGLEQYFQADKFVALIEEIKSAGWLQKIVKGLALIPIVVGMVEKLYNELSEIQGGGGEEKKKAVVEWLDDCIKGNFLIEQIDDFVIPLAVDGFVGWLNLTKGKQWIDVSKDFLGIE